MLIVMVPGRVVFRSGSGFGVRVMVMVTTMMGYGQVYCNDFGSGLGFRK